MPMLGKTCPACGHRQLSPRPTPKKPLVWLGVAQALVCDRCRQPLLYGLGVAWAVERRRAERKRLPLHFLIRIPGPVNQFATISNISQGGICFALHAAVPTAAGSRLCLDLYNCNDGSSLDGLVVEILAKREPPRALNSGGIPRIQQSARFIRLNQAQKKVVLACMEREGIVPFIPR